MQFCARRPSMTDSSLTFRVLTQRSSMEPVSFCRTDTTGCSSKPPPQGGDNRHLQKTSPQVSPHNSPAGGNSHHGCVHSGSASFEGRLCQKKLKDTTNAHYFWHVPSVNREYTSYISVSQNSLRFTAASLFFLVRQNFIDTIKCMFSNFTVY